MTNLSCIDSKRRQIKRCCMMKTNSKAEKAITGTVDQT